MEWALTFEQVEIKAQEIYGKMADQRDRVARGKGDQSKEDDESRLADLMAQIEAQGGVVKRRDGSDG